MKQDEFPMVIASRVEHGFGNSNWRFKIYTTSRCYGLASITIYPSLEKAKRAGKRMLLKFKSQKGK